MDKSYYRDTLVLHGHLNTSTYFKASSNEDEIVMKNLKSLIKKHNVTLTKKEQNFITDFDLKSSNFYVLPKIHKSKEIIEKIKSSNNKFINMLPPSD